MKKVLLSSAALAALAFAAPAFAQEESGVKLNLGGHFKGYGAYVSQDDDTSAVRSFDMLRDTEVHFGGETTLDNGLTVGAHIEADADNGDSFGIDESYLYMSGSWGRVNVGSEDGAAFLLQVAAPSADSNFDGVRQFIQPINATAGVFDHTNLDYAQDVSGKSDKVTYLTPVFSGFQAGVSYTPNLGSSRSTAGVGLDDQGTATSPSDIYDVAARYEANMSDVDLTLGAGYTSGSNDSGTGDDREAWNVGVDLGLGAWGLGAVYLVDNIGDANDDVTTWVVGTDYTTGPFTLGASYLTEQDDVGTDNETDRYTGGVVYSYGPGMTFRGTVSYLTQDITGGNDVNGTAVMLGTQVNF
jgi:outer membrane protein OmpU